MEPKAKTLVLAKNPRAKVAKQDLDLGLALLNPVLTKAPNPVLAKKNHQKAPRLVTALEIVGPPERLNAKNAAPKDMPKVLGATKLE
jgi:hypothetical protein